MTTQDKIDWLKKHDFDVKIFMSKAIISDPFGGDDGFYLEGESESAINEAYEHLVTILS